MDDEIKYILKKVGSGLALAGTCALILGIVYFGVKYGTNTNRKETDVKETSECSCDGSECECADEIEAE